MKSITRCFSNWRVYLQVLLGLLLLAACSGDESGSPTLVIPTPLAGGSTTAVGDTPVIAPTLPLDATLSITTTVQGEGVATPTLAATTEALPTPGPTVVTDPPIQTVNSAPLPATTRDLLFIADGALKLWRADNRQVDVLLPGGAETADQPRTEFQPVVGDLTRFSVSENGRQVVTARLVQTETITRTLPDSGTPLAFDYQTYELIFVNLDNRQGRTLAANVAALSDFQLSSDGQQLAYVAAAPNAPREDAQDQQAVYLLETGNGQPLKTPAVCSRPCRGLAWHPDNNLIVWGEAEDVRLFNLAASQPEALLDNPAGAPEETTFYTPIDWAANGRFLLMWATLFEGGSRVVLDVPTRALMPLPDSFVYADPFSTEVMWMQDDRLLVLRPGLGNLDNVNRPTLELWRVLPDEARINREEARVLANERVYATGGQHLENGRFAYVLTNETNTPTNGFYILTALSEVETPERVNAILPAEFAPHVAWSPDGAGAIAAVRDGLLYAPADGNFLYDVQPVLGRLAHSFYWLPPRPPQ